MEIYYLVGQLLCCPPGDVEEDGRSNAGHDVGEGPVRSVLHLRQRSDWQTRQTCCPTHPVVVVRPADCQVPLDSRAHNEEY